MKRILFLALILLSCSNNEGQIAEIRIRLSNISEYSFENLKYNPSSRVINLEILNANEISDFEIFEMAYELAFIEFKVNEETFALSPVDLLGEVPLSNGDYTYEIDFNPELLVPVSTQLIME